MRLQQKKFYNFLSWDVTGPPNDLKDIATSYSVLHCLYLCRKIIPSTLCCICFKWINEKKKPAGLAKQQKFLNIGELDTSVFLLPVTARKRASL